MSKFMKKLQSKIEKVLDDHDKPSMKTTGSGQQHLPTTLSQGHPPAPAPANVPVPPLAEPPTQRQIYRFRKQRGVNLGSWFTLENWLTPSLFTHAVHPKASEMDVLKGMGAPTRPDAKAMLEKHWKTFVDEGDWAWLVEHGINTVRIPVSYHHFLPSHPDPEVRQLIRGTDYEPFGDVYVDAWGCIVQGIQAAHAHGIGVLVDLHAAPGAQNTDSHSGTSRGRAGLWEDSRAGEYQRRTVDILVAMAREVIQFDNVVGLELLNEPKNNGRLMGWYDEAIAAIRSLGPHAQELPIYVSDAWDTNWYSNYVNTHSSPGSFIVLDHAKSASQHAREVHPSNPHGPSASMLDKASKETQGSIVIGEWSAALNPASLNSYPNDQARHAAQREWGRAQWEAYERWCAGWFFWTLKKEGGSDAGWCYYTAVEQGVLPAHADRTKSVFGRHSLETLRGRGQAEKESAFQAHVGWWSSNSSNPSEMEHWRFEQGFYQGWEDCLAFYFGSTTGELTGSEIGFVGQWKRLRTEAHRREKGDSRMVWEFEHGFEQAVSKFREAASNT